MNYHLDEEGIPTLELAVGSMTADELRKLAALTGQRVPSRKGDIAAAHAKAQRPPRSGLRR
jgi:hypothetical protein